LFERYGDVQAFGVNTAAWSAENWRKPSPDNPLIAAMNAYMTNYGPYRLMILVDTRGQVLAINSADSTGKALDTAGVYEKSFADASWFRKAMKGEYLQGSKGFTGTVVEQPAANELVSSASTELRTAAGSLSSTAEETSRQSTAVAAASEQASTNVQTVAAATEELSSSIGEISGISTTIASAVEEQGAATQEIARNVQQAAQGTGEVSSNITGVTQAASQTSAAAGQVLSSSGERSKQAADLRTQVDDFLSKVRAA